MFTHLKEILVNDSQLTNILTLTQSEVKTEQPKTQVSINTDSPIASAGTTLAFVAFWVIFLLILSKKRIFARDGELVSLNNHLYKLPCQKCKYFTKNYYLQCAVQPGTVLTEEAKDCPDYCPKNANLTKRRYWFFTKNK